MAHRFYDIAWGAPSDQHPRGVIAGAMEDGSLQLWDAAKLLAGEEALMSRDTKHTGPIKALQFNPLRPQVLATAGAKGELYVWDVNDTSTAFRLGSAAAQDIDCLAWNCKVANILATGSAGGFVTVWDLKTKKASLTLNNNRKPVSALAWDPNNSTSILTATSDDNTPVILLWNLRNSQAPERTLQGHEQGILSLSWCQQDTGLLLSAGKDNRTLVWNPHTGERYGEFPEATNWTFSTRFNPHNPSLSATAAFDGKIVIQTLQNTNPTAVPQTQAALDDDDFFSRAATQPQGVSFSLSRAPTWLERPVGVSFGYAGKLVIFKKHDTPAGQHRSSKITISTFSVDSDIGAATEKFEEAIKKGDIASICDSHIEAAKTEEEKADWQVLKTLSQDDGRSKIIEYLGFSKDEEARESGLTSPKEESAEGVTSPQTNGEEPKKKSHKRVTSMWGDIDDGDDFLSELTPAKGAKTDDPFHLIGEGSSVDDQITKAVLLGNFEMAVNLCVKEDRIADAFVLANCGGKELVDKVQSSYLAKKKGSTSYLRLINSVTSKNLWDVVYNADLSNWKEAMVTLCTFAEPAEFPDLCEALGDRIYESGERKDASFCYLVGSKLEKVVDIWIAELQEAEQAGLSEETNDTSFSIHARALQKFIEKVTVFRHVSKFTDNEKQLSEGWKLAALYNKYTEYADIVAAQGHLAVAQRYLDLLPANFPAAEVARNRVKLAIQKAAPQPAGPTARVPSRTAAPVGYQQPGGLPSPANPYAPPAPTFQTQAPAPASAPNPYAPTTTSQYQPPTGASPYAPAPGFTPSPSITSGYAPPQPSFNQPPPPPQPKPYVKKDVGNWNDVPMVTKLPVRRSTPSAPPITSPFSNQAGTQTPPPPMGGYGRPQPTPPPPPPKGPAPPPRNTASPSVGPPPAAAQHPPRPGSVSSNASTNPYAPPPQPVSNILQPPVVPPPPRTSSPYNPPPAGPPPSNRYAPAPSSQPAPAAPPSASPYAPPPAMPPVAPPSQYGPPPQASRPPVGPPPRAGPPPAVSAPPPQQAPPQAPPQPQSPPPQQQKQRHPPGDRSHIPPNAKNMVEILDRDMQRVAAKAPSTFLPQVKDTQKRLGILFDHLNNSDLSDWTVSKLSELADALESKNYDVAHRLQVEIQTEKTGECGQWMVSTSLLFS